MALRRGTFDSRRHPDATVVDLGLDPAAVALGFCTYPAGGAYYGVPLSNYLDSALSATVAVLLGLALAGGRRTTAHTPIES